MENENLDLDAEVDTDVDAAVKPAGNKDLWLFLIIVDIIFMCVFGFFLYKHFSANLFNASRPRTETPAQTRNEPQLPVVEVEDVVLPTQTPAKPAVPAVSEKAPVAPKPAPAPAVKTNAAPEVKPAAEEAAKPAPAKAQETPVREEKKSVIVSNNPKSSKYRRVTFRWFGDGEKVSIVSGFTMSKPQALKKQKDFWETTLSIAPGTYKFLYIVDGVNVTDPYSEQKDGRSVVVIE